MGLIWSTCTALPRDAGERAGAPGHAGAGRRGGRRRGGHRRVDRPRQRAGGGGARSRRLCGGGGGGGSNLIIGTNAYMLATSGDASQIKKLACWVIRLKKLAYGGGDSTQELAYSGV